MSNKNFMSYSDAETVLTEFANNIKAMGNANVPIGAIFPFGGSTAPSGYLMCDGSAVSRSDYSALFAVIGTSFGSGDGSTTFNVPDLRETVPVGIGENGTQTIGNHDTYTLGEYKDDQLQNITGNTKTGFYAKGNTNSGSGALRYIKSGTTKAMESAYTDSYGNITFDASLVARTGTTTHGKQLGVNYIIKAK